MKHYDTIIIGAGLSGLAAGIRLSHYGQNVLLLESHSRAGGLNSYYSRQGRNIDAGLHAMTNYVPAGTRGAPLTKLLRQLRIKHDELQLVEQSASSISFPQANLKFTNDFSVLQSEIQRRFPHSHEGFLALASEIDALEETALDAKEESARENIGRFITDPLLIDMLLCPLMYYGNPKEHDMDWVHFAVMWKSVFTSGFCRPKQGMKYVINLLLERFENNGGELRYNSPVTEIVNNGSSVTSVRLANGDEFFATRVLSSAGSCETMSLCGIDESANIGQLSFAELVLFLDIPPKELGFDDCITFFSQQNEFDFSVSTDLLDPSSGVVCCPDNFNYPEPAAEGQLRLTMKAGYDSWKSLTADEYKIAKAKAIDTMIATAEKFAPGIKEHITFTDMFTPLTIERYTRHFNGAIYGAPNKNRPATTKFDNLFLIGTDQGFLGIVGALLSGITVANLHCLK